MPENPTAKNENDGWSRALAALLILLTSFACVFCSAQSALWFIDRSRVEAQTLASNRADYAPDAPYPLTFYPRVNPKIGEEAQADAVALAATRTPETNNNDDELIALIPALPTPSPTIPLPEPALPPPPSPIPSPTSPPTPQPDDGPAPTAAPPPPPTAPPTTEPPATPQPTAVPPTPPPTALPTMQPTVPPATVQPTVPPATVAPTQTPVPPTLVPATATVNPPATATPMLRLFFSATTYSVVEGDASALITVQLAPANTAQTVTVNYSTSNGSATAPADYAAASGTLTFAPGQTSQTFSVPIVDDLLDEPDETLTLSLSAAVNAELGNPNPASLTILDNDNPPTVAFERLTFTVLENTPAGQATITAILSSASALPVSVNYRTDNGSATAPADYAAASGTLTFSPGQTSQSFSVPIVNDAFNEFDETVSLTLSNPANAALGSPNPATLLIQEDDFPTLQFEQPASSIVETNGLAVITTTLSSSSARLITATYTSSDLTALAGVDYLTSTGTITFAPGSTNTTFTVPIIDDMLTNEFTETVRLTLSNPVNASLGSQNPASLSISDDDGQPVVGFVTAAYSVNEGDDGGTGVITHPITVILAAPSALTVTVTYTDAGSGSASAGADYLSPISGTLTFAPNQTGQSFEVVVISDTLNEANETINLTLSNPTEAALGLANTTVNIIDDDAPGALPCSGPSDAGEPDVGLPDGQYSRVSCGGELVVDLGTTPIQTDGTTGYDLVYYEREEPAAIPPIIFMDWVVVQVGSTPTGPWYTVFYWGDGLADDNSNVGQFLANPTNETDNRQIFTTNPPLYGPVGPLNLTTGIAIDVDARAPAGTYPFVRFFVPLGGGNDVVEIDAVQPLP